MNKNPTNKRIIALVRERDEALAALSAAKKEIEALVSECLWVHEENLLQRHIARTIEEEDRDVLEELAKED